MKTNKLFTLILLAFMLVSFSLISAEEKADAKEAVKELKNQTHCPVMGGKIDSTSFTDIQGQRVYHCCPGCSSPLKKDPDKFFKKAAADGVIYENIQTNCPVSGEKLDKKSVQLDFEGRRLLFCCDDCVKTFTKDPQKVLSTMDGKKEKMKKDSGEDHSGHNH